MLVAFLLWLTAGISGATSDAPGLGAVLATVSAEWESLREEADLDPQAIASWVPESGIRGRYAIVKPMLSLSVLERLIGEKAFLSGPHGEQVDFTSATEFGRYNPVFIDKLQAQLAGLFASEAFVLAVQPLYDAQLQGYLRACYLAHQVAANKPVLMAGYLAAIARERDSPPSGQRVFLAAPSRYLQDSFMEFATRLQGQFDVYEAVTCPGFWVRRSIDGTSGQFHELLLLTLRTFDGEFLARQ